MLLPKIRLAGTVFKARTSSLKLAVVFFGVGMKKIGCLCTEIFEKFRC